MKSFKEYLTESKKTYDFRIKVVGDLPEKFESTLKTLLEKYSVSSMTKSSTPIQKLPLDFPNYTNETVHIFDVIFDYPVTSPILTSYVSEGTGVELSRIVVRSPNEPSEEYQEGMGEKDSPYNVLLTDPKMDGYYKDDAQKLVGEKHMMNFLKELTNDKHKLTQYTGINDEILAKTMPTNSDQKEQTNKDAAAKSLLANKKVSNSKGTRS